MVHININETYRYMEKKHHQNSEPQGSQQVLQNPSLSFAKKCKSVCTMKCQTIPKSPTLKISQKIQYIDNSNPFPCL